MFHLGKKLFSCVLFAYRIMDCDFIDVLLVRVIAKFYNYLLIYNKFIVYLHGILSFC